MVGSLCVAADARVVGQEQIAAAGELRGRAHGQLGELVDAARCDGIDVHAQRARPRIASAMACGVLVVMRRVGDPERELGGRAVAGASRAG